MATVTIVKFMKWHWKGPDHNPVGVCTINDFVARIEDCDGDIARCCIQNKDGTVLIDQEFREIDEAQKCAEMYLLQNVTGLRRGMFKEWKLEMESLKEDRDALSNLVDGLNPVLILPMQNLAA